LHGEEQAADIGVERFIEMFLTDFTKFSKLVKTGVDEEHVDPACLRFHGFVNALDVSKIRGVALNGGDGTFDCRDRHIELGSAAASDKHSSAFLGETLSGTKADASTAASYDRYFVFEFPVHKI
jgi:hypothetical protein